MLVPALPDLIKQLHTTPTGAAWTLTGYLISAAIFTPIAGRLGDMFGKRRLLVASLGVFAAGTVVSALGRDIDVVVAGRVLQGAGGGVFPLCFGIIRDEFPREQVGRSIGLLSAVLGIGGGLGLIAGGLIVDHVSYHWIFWIGTIMAVVAAVSAELAIPESPVRSPGRVDVRGALLLAVALVAPLLAISNANAWGWASARTLGLIGAGIVLLVLWVAVQRRTEDPLADIATLSRPPVLATNIATLLVGFGMFGSFILVPTLAQAPTSTGYGFGLDATGAGFLLMPGSLVMLVLGPLSGVLGNRFGNKVPLAVGGLVTALGLALLAADHGSQGVVLAFSIIMTGGIALAFAAMPNLIVEAVPATETGQATGFNAVVRSVGSSLGTQVTAAIVAGSAVRGVPADSGYTHAFAVSAVVAVVAGLVAMLIPSVRRAGHLPPLEEVGAASPLGDPAYAEERF